MFEQLNVACQWILDNHIQIPNEEHLHSLLSKATALLNTLQADEPRIIQYGKLPNDNLQHRKPNKEFTEPYYWFCQLMAASKKGEGLPVSRIQESVLSKLLSSN